MSYYLPINRLHSLNQHLLSSVFNRCNIPKLSTATLSISEKEFEEVIPSMKFWFSFVSTAQRERILSVKQRDVVVQSFSLYLEIIVIFLQTLALSLSWTMRSVNLTAVLPRCFLIQLSCRFFAVSLKTCNSTISLQLLLYHLILKSVSILLKANNLLRCFLWKYFSSDEVFNVMKLFVF